MTVAVLLGAAVALLAISRTVERHARTTASPTALACLALVTLVGLALIPLAAAACLGANALDEHRSTAGSTALLSSAIGLVALSALRFGHELRRTRGEHGRIDRTAASLEPTRDGIVIVPHDRAAAFSTQRTVVVTSRLAATFEPDELAAVVAHERAHQRGGHARLARWARALRRVSIGGRLAEHDLRLHLETAADHDAALAIGQPALVARALQTHPDHHAASQRLAALSGTRTRPAEITVRVAIAAAAAIVFIAICAAMHAIYLGLGITACAAAGLYVALLLRPLRTHSPAET
ncbi:MAG: M48 family metalloprotease, partial [Actinomycetota bacterium]